MLLEVLGYSTLTINQVCREEQSQGMLGLISAEAGYHERVEC
jgi:hypothetical protein